MNIFRGSIGKLPFFEFVVGPQDGLKCGVDCDWSTIYRIKTDNKQLVAREVKEDMVSVSANERGCDAIAENGIH